MSPDTCTNCATHSQWKILDKKRQVTAPLTLQTSFISRTRCRFHDWFLLRLEIVEVCLKYPLRSQQCPSSIKLSPTRLYVYLSQYLGLDKRPTDHFIPQTTYLTNLTICTWFTAVNDISLGRKTSQKKRSWLFMRYCWKCWYSHFACLCLWSDWVTRAPQWPAHAWQRLSRG